MNICAGFAIAIRNSILCSSAFLAEPLDKLNVKSLEAVSSYGQSLAQWAFVIVGGSLVLILGNSHRWPKSRILRATYILFPGAWFCLAKSIYLGSRVQQAYLAYLLVPPATIESAVRTVTARVNHLETGAHGI